MPVVTEGCFRVPFFFSFFGRIVSLLGLVRRLPFEPWTPPPGATATCGIEVTISVSTVMLCRDVSPAFPFPTAGLTEVLDCLVVNGGAIEDPAVRRLALMLPLSLPLSFILAFEAKLLMIEASAVSACEDSDMKLSSNFSSIESSGTLGELRGLTSCTVSRVDALPPAPRAGVLAPD